MNAPATTHPETAASKYAPGVIKRPNRYFIDPRTIMIREGWNHRFDFGDIELLADQIEAEMKRDPASGGLIHDIHVRKLDAPVKPTSGTGPDWLFSVTDGERRTMAINVLLKRGVGFPEGVPVKIVAASADVVGLLVRSFVANQAKMLLPLEQAYAFDKMKKAGMTLKDIERETGMSDNTIVGALALLDSPDELKDAVKSGAVGGTMAKSIAVNARGDKELQKTLTAAAAAAGKDRKALAAVKTKVDDARRAKAAKKGLKLKMRALTDEQLSAIGAKMSEVLMGQMAALGLPADTVLTDWIAGADLEQRIGYTFGVLQGLKAAAGVPVAMVLAPVPAPAAKPRTSVLTAPV